MGLRRRRHARLLDRRDAPRPAHRRDARGDAAEPDPVRGRRLREERDRGRRRRLRAQRGAAGRRERADVPIAAASTCSRPRRTSPIAELGCKRAGPLQHRLARGQLQRRGLAVDAQAQVPAQDGRLVGAVQAGGLAPDRRPVRAGRRLLLGALLRRATGARSPTPGTARARGSWTSRTRRSRSRSPTGGRTTRSSGRRTSGRATSTPRTTCAASTCCKLTSGAKLARSVQARGRGQADVRRSSAASWPGRRGSTAPTRHARALPADPVTAERATTAARHRVGGAPSCRHTSRQTADGGSSSAASAPSIVI